MRESTKSLISSLLVVAVNCQSQNESFSVTGCNVDPNTASVSFSVLQLYRSYETFRTFQLLFIWDNYIESFNKRLRDPLWLIKSLKIFFKIIWAVKKVITHSKMAISRRLLMKMTSRLLLMTLMMVSTLNIQLS